MGIPQKYIITGGPGSGKTSLLTALQGHGYPVFDEVARQIIREQQALQSDKVPWLDYAGFSDLIYDRMMSRWPATNDHEVSFHDRGMPDIIGYLHWKKLPVPDHYNQAIPDYGYAKTVFVTPPWVEIYGNDAERKESFEEAVDLHHHVIEVYREMGFTLIELPKMAVENRLSFLMEQLPLQERPSSFKTLV